MSTNKTADDSNKLSSGKQLLEKDRDLCTQWLACSIFVEKNTVLQINALNSAIERKNKTIFCFCFMMKT